MNKPHKHAELIKAWADGAEIEYKSHVDGSWRNLTSGQWLDNYEYRLKPIPKPDKVSYGVYKSAAEVYYNFTMICYSQCPSHVSHDYNLVKLTYDGETGKLKSAEVMK